MRKVAVIPGLGVLSETSHPAGAPRFREVGQRVEYMRTGEPLAPPIRTRIGPTIAPWQRRILTGVRFG